MRHSRGRPAEGARRSSGCGRRTARSTGPRKNREGTGVARCTVERLTKEMGHGGPHFICSLRFGGNSLKKRHLVAARGFLMIRTDYT